MFLFVICAISMCGSAAECDFFSFYSLFQEKNSKVVCLLLPVLFGYVCCKASGQNGGGLAASAGTKALEASVSSSREHSGTGLKTELGSGFCPLPSSQQLSTSSLLHPFLYTCFDSLYPSSSFFLWSAISWHSCIDTL